MGKKTISVGGNKTYTLSGEVELAKGEHELLVATVPVKADAFGKLAPLPLSPRVTVTGPVGGDVHEHPESHTRVFFKGAAPADAKARRAHAREILGRLAGKAFRRPPADATLDRLTDMALAGRTFEAGVAQTATAILNSPRFYYRAELQPNSDDPREAHPLDEYALASRLPSPPRSRIMHLGGSGPCWWCREARNPGRNWETHAALGARSPIP